LFRSIIIPAGQATPQPGGATSKTKLLHTEGEPDNADRKGDLPYAKAEEQGDGEDRGASSNVEAFFNALKLNLNREIM